MPSKLGPHALRPTSDARQMVEAGCNIIKLVDDFGAVGSYLAANPKLIVIGRSVSPTNFLEQLGREGSPVAAARRFIQDQMLTYQLNPAIKIWEGHNEPSFGGPDEAEALERMGQYAAFEAERLRLLAGMGLRGVIGNFSTGYPHIEANDLRMWQAFAPALQAAEQYDAILGLHEYAAPWLWWWTGDYQAANCGRPDKWGWPGAFDMGWLTLRYRQVWCYILSKISPKVKIAITELGLDRAGGGCLGMTTGNWRDMADWWGRWDGKADPIDYWKSGGRDAERYYAEQLIWYDRRLREDVYVLGATVFTFGSNDIWIRYDVAGTRIPGYLIDYIKTEAETQDPEAPGDDTPPDDGDDEMPTTDTTNLLANADFDDGQHYHWRDVNEIVIPNKWDFWYADYNTKWLPRQDQNFDPPECVVWNKKDADPKEYGFWLSGDYNLKVFKGWGVIWWRLFQKVTGLTVGNKYRFTAPVHPDLVMDYRDDGSKIYANDPLAGEVRLSANTAGKVIETGWKTGADFPFGVYTEHVLEFTAEEAEVEVSIEARCRWGLINDGWFIDSPKLVEIVGQSDPGDETDPPTGDGNTVSVKDLLVKALVELGEARAQVMKAEASVGAAMDLVAG